MGMIDHDQQTANQTQNYYLRKTLQFLVPISIISFLLLSLIFHNLQFHSSFYPFLDRKCMFLVCNGILAFLGFTNHHQIPEMLAAVPQENEILPLQQHQDDGVSEEILEITREMVVSTTTLESEEWGEEDEDEDEDEDEEEGGLGAEDTTACVNEMRVSTEEMNKKFDEFIRRMKEEIRIDEAREQYNYMIAV